MNDLIFLLFVVITIVLFIKYSNLKGNTEHRISEQVEIWKKKELTQAILPYETQSKKAIAETENYRIQLKKDNENFRAESERQAKEAIEKNKILTEKALEDTNNLREGLQKEVEQYKAELKEQSKKNTELQLNEWRQKEEKGIRTDATNRSKSVIMGKATEHLAPFLPDFKYNPRDARFLGEPIDIIIFDGLNERNIKKIVIMEVKTGKTCRLTSNELQIKNAIIDKNIEFETLHIKPDVINSEEEEITPENSNIKVEYIDEIAPTEQITSEQVKPFVKKVFIVNKSK